MDSKACTKCLVVKPLSEFGKHNIGKNGLRSVCKPCNAAYAIKWRKNNPEDVEKSNQRNKKWRINNTEKAKKWRINNTEKAKASEKRASKKARKALKLAYVKKLLLQHGFTRDQITPELIALKTEQLEIKRMARQLKKAAIEAAK